ncbi:hypothetical protein RZS08_14485, partial [Arthrospira platensis SPKY1]|nr:hypothetical protein [Arthrospira platensis SPKY1]
VLSNVIDTAISEQLFVSDGIYFWSESLRARKKEFHKSREQKSIAGKKGMEKRWGKKNKSTENTDLDNGVITDDNSVIAEEESVITENNKGKERKRKEKKYIYTIEQINEIWDYYCEKLKELGKTRKKTENKIKHIKARLEESFTT